MPTLSNICQEIKALQDLLDSVYEEKDDDERELDRTNPDSHIAEIEFIVKDMCELSGERDKKINSYIALIKYYEYYAEVRKREAKRLSKLGLSDENKASHLRALLKENLEYIGIEKLKLDNYNISITLAGGLVKLELDDTIPLKEIPPEFKEISIDYDKKAIREFLNAGNELNFAKLGARNRVLRIK